MGSALFCQIANGHLSLCFWILYLRKKNAPMRLLHACHFCICYQFRPLSNTPYIYKGCRRFDQIQMYLYNKKCLDTSEFRQTFDILFWTEVVAYLWTWDSYAGNLQDCVCVSISLVAYEGEIALVAEWSKTRTGGIAYVGFSYFFYPYAVCVCILDAVLL
jgi:hypothetical protein